MMFNPIGVLDGCEEFFDNEPYDGNVYGIINVEFDQEKLYKPNVIFSKLSNEEKRELIDQRVRSIKRQRCKAIDEFNRQVAEHLELTNKCYIPDENIIILWKNNPSLNKMEERGHSTDYLLSLFCERISLKKDKETRIYISKPNALRDEKDKTIGHMLERLNYIWKSTGIIPEFLKDKFIIKSEMADLNPFEYEKYIKAEKDFKETSAFYKSMSESLDENMKAMYNDTLAKVAEDRFTNEVLQPILKPADDRFAIRFFKSIEKLCEIIATEQEEDKEEDKDMSLYFIPYYYKMQVGEMTFNDVKEALHYDMNCSNVYKWSNEFQENPIYADYINCWVEDIWDVERTIGTMPDGIEFLVCCARLRAAHEKNSNRLHREVYLESNKMYSPAEYDRILMRACNEAFNLKEKKTSEYNSRIAELVPDKEEREQIKEYIETYFIKKKEA